MSQFPLPDAWLEHRVSYGETDSMAVLYYAEYLHIFERARNLLIRSRGVSYNEVEQKGIYLPVRHAECRYRSPVRYDDLLLVRVGISEWGRASITFTYEAWNENKTTLHANGNTQHATVNNQGRPV
ncbi:acyl-CoA thioesterase, partial [Desulfovibrio sp. OttesenSCG-928-C14]|nr:acyl-CoA thioesterase [Desulfovibrio sp. OttesenSCG-928-C14]